MANKRDLKKVIRAVCGDIAGECILARHFIPNIDHKKMDEFIVDAAELQSASLDKVSFSFDKTEKNFGNGHEYRKACRSYYKKGYAKLRAEFDAAVVEIIKQMNSTLTPEQKEINKTK